MENIEQRRISTFSLRFCEQYLIDASSIVDQSESERELTDMEPFALLVDRICTDLERFGNHCCSHRTADRHVVFARENEMCIHHTFLPHNSLESAKCIESRHFSARYRRCCDRNVRRETSRVQHNLIANSIGSRDRQKSNRSDCNPNEAVERVLRPTRRH